MNWKNPSVILLLTLGLSVQWWREKDSEEEESPPAKPDHLTPAKFPEVADHPNQVGANQ